MGSHHTLVAFTHNNAEQFLLSLFNIQRPEYLHDRTWNALYLKRTQFLLDLLGNPEKKISHFIHVAGTSGKGSVCRYLSFILVNAHKKTGLFISPYPTTIRENWSINNEIISEKDFSSLVHEMKKALTLCLEQSPFGVPSYFEVTTAMALTYFAKNGVDWAVMEVGLGGQFDATNVIPKKECAIITTIGLDHTEILGSTKTAIAKEKAGIITVQCPVWTMEQNPRVLSVIRNICAKKHARLMVIRPEFQMLSQTRDRTTFTHKGHRYTIRATGIHQVQNACLVIDVAKSLGIPSASIHDGLRGAWQPLCCEIVSKKPMVILDGAHNPDKMRATVRTILDLQKKKKLPKSTHLIVSFSEDKDFRSMIRLLTKLRPRSVAISRNTMNPFRRIADLSTVKKLFERQLPRSSYRRFIDPSDAYTWSTKKQKKTHGIILVTGSMFLSGELRGTLTK